MKNEKMGKRGKENGKSKSGSLPMESRNEAFDWNCSLVYWFLSSKMRHPALFIYSSMAILYHYGKFTRKSAL